MDPAEFLRFVQYTVLAAVSVKWYHEIYPKTTSFTLPKTLLQNNFCELWLSGLFPDETYIFNDF